MKYIVCLSVAVFYMWILISELNLVGASKLYTILGLTIIACTFGHQWESLE